MDNDNKKEKRPREVWFDGRQVPLERSDIWSMISNSRIRRVVVTPAQRRDGRFPLKTEMITEIQSRGDLEAIPPGEIVISSDRHLLRKAKKRGHPTCIALSITGRRALEDSLEDAARHDFAVIDFDLPTNIPLELILARLQKRQTMLLKRETDFAGLEVAFGVMEQGSDGVLLATTDLNQIAKTCSYLSQQDARHLELRPMVVKEVRHIGMGARACIDTTGLMNQEEGMIVGSTSSGGVFVCSETHYLPYMNLRPFRVNAGAVHSYIWMPNNTAEYLTDLTAGSRVLCVNTRGEAREMTVGRVKIEMRPLLCIRGEVDGQELNVIVQDDWHIRLMGADGKPKNATAIRPGDRLLAHLSAPGRHVGIKVDETIIEK